VVLETPRFILGNDTVDERGNVAQLHTEFDVNSLFKSEVHSSNSKNHHWQRTRGFPPRPAA
jgi:hypothetical protein